MSATVRDNNVNQQKTSKSYEKFARLRHIFESKMVFYNKKFELNEILDLDGDINYQTSDTGDTVLHFAVNSSSGRKEKFALQLIDRGADPTIANRKGQTPVHFVAISFKNPIQKFYLCQSVRDILSIVHIRNGNTTNFKDIHGFSHFHAAFTINDLELVEFFLKNGVDVNEAVDINSSEYAGYTSLHFAVEFGSDELVNKLMDHGATLTKDSNGMSALHVPIRRNMEIIQHMSLYRIPVYDDRDIGTMSMNEEIVLAEMEANEKIITSIISKSSRTVMDGVDLLPFYVVRTLDDDSLHWTLRDVNKCIPMNSACWPGYTALHFAARFDIDTVKLLLDKGADLEAKDADGVTPFDLCVGRYSVEDIHFIITKHNVWRYILLSDGKTKLLDLVLAMRQPESFIKFLAERDVNGMSIPQDSPLWPGFTILHLVVTLSKKRMRSRVHRYDKLLDDDDRKRKSNELIKMCLDLDANVAADDSNGSTPIHLAFRRMDLDAMHHLLEHCLGNSNPTDMDNLSLLHIVCALENENLVKELLSSGAEPNATVSSSFQWDPEVKYFHELSDLDKQLHVWPGSTPLHVALMTNAKNGRKVVKLLIKAGADLYAKDAFGLAPLHRLIKLHPESEIVDDDFLSEFITGDCVVDGLSYLHVAAHRNYSKTVKKLLDLGANVNSTIIARERLNSKCCHNVALHMRKIELSYFFNYFNGNTPLHMANYYCYDKSDILKTLMSSGADILAKNSEGISPIRDILKYKVLVRHLLSVMSADDDEKRLFDEVGLTKLHLACQLRDEKMIRDCLKNGANANARIRDDSEVWPGFTPLHVVVGGYYYYNFYGNDDVNMPSYLDDITTWQNKVLRKEKILRRITRLLLKGGADVTIADAKGETPLMISIRENHVEGSSAHIDILWKELKNSEVNPVSDKGISHFHLACIRHDVVLVKRFLKLGVDPNQTVDYLSEDYPGYTPLHFAVSRKRNILKELPSVRTINLLLKYGANIDARNVNYDTPLHLAAKLPLISALPYKRLFWAGADPEAKNLYGRVPGNRMFSIDRKKFLRHILNHATRGSRKYLLRRFSSCVRYVYRVYDRVHENRNIVTKKKRKKN